ncbi:vitellogenin-1-like [Lutzomyia longipalpis]|uniref:vitellogenin-1-like n=1 Tax=Lutzomyia longipalpis TaxID=7200 RepID=UPI0024837FD9|nr:vitellogenin-1-like [Lutzomyia longipalpis]
MKSLKSFINFALFCSVLVIISNVSEAQDTKTNSTTAKGRQNFPPVEEIGSYGVEKLLNLNPTDMLEYINEFCSRGAQINNAAAFDYKDISLTLYDGKENTPFLLTNMGNLMQHPSFNKTQNVVVFVPGWLSNLQESPNAAADTIYKAYECRGSTNFLVMDTTKQINTLGASTAENTLNMGQYLANALKDLTESIKISQIHLIGHSLGAHIVGAAGRFFKSITGKNLPRITGLDPGRVCFVEQNGNFDLERGDADFVDIIHTNPNSLGKEETIGNANFYPNGLNLMPGCNDAICSHKMAWRYYAESVYPSNKFGFSGKKCLTENLRNLTNTDCGGQSEPMGYATPATATGNYFLQTNPKEPYGKNSKNDKKCGIVEANIIDIFSSIATAERTDSPDNLPVWS